MMDRNRVYVLHWFGPFKNLDEVKGWENINGNDTYLYMFQGKRERKKKLTSYYFGQAFQQSAGTRMKNNKHHIEEVAFRMDYLKIWVAKFENKKPTKADVNVVENLFISFMSQSMIGQNEEVLNKTSLLAPRVQLYVINEWYNPQSIDLERYLHSTLPSRIPDVMIFYPNGNLFTSKKISFHAELER